jgi:DNA-binding NarL/FixJ family response regulator
MKPDIFSSMRSQHKQLPADCNDNTEGSMSPISSPPGQTGPVRLLLIDHLPTFRDSLRHTISQTKTLLVTGEAERAEEVYSGKISIDADVALVDVDLPDCLGFDICQWLVSHNSHLVVVCLIYRDWDTYLVGARASGAKGVILRNTPTLEIVRSVEKAAFGPIFTREQVKRVQKWGETVGAPLRSFRAREWQVLWLAADGLNNHAIALKVDLSENTIEKIMTVLLERLGLRSRSQLLALVHNQHLDVLRCLENNRLLTFP